jgi:hypothetical protein
MVFMGAVGDEPNALVLIYLVAVFIYCDLKLPLRHKHVLFNVALVRFPAEGGSWLYLNIIDLK